MSSTPKGGEGLRKAGLVLVLPPANKVATAFDGLELSHSVRNQLVPLLLRLADQELSPAELVESVLDDIDTYARRTTRPNENERREGIIRNQLREVPTYLGAFITDPQTLEEVCENFEQALERIAAADHVETEEIEDQSFEVEKLLAGASREARRTIRRIMDTPESRRTVKDQRTLQKLLGRLANQAAGHDKPSPKSQKKPKHPSQRQQAELWARRNQT